MAGFDYTDLTVQVRRDAEQNLYFFGVVLDGAYVVLATRKVGGVDADIATAQAVAAGTWKPPATADGSTPNTTLPHVVSAPPAASDQPAPAPGPDETPPPAA